MTYRLRNILLAVVLAVLAAFLTAVYVANYQNRVDEGQEKVMVFVANADIAPGTPAAQLRSKVEQQEVLRRNVVPVAVIDFTTVEGKTASQWIYAGEQLSARRFTEVGRIGIHGELKGNLRAIQVAGTQQQVLAGILRTGDHVDVVANIRLDQETNVTRVLLRDLKILRAAQAGSVDSRVATSATQGGFSVVLQVTDAQAHKLYFVTAGNESHEWTLQLRAPADATDSPESLSTMSNVVRDGLPNNQAEGLGGDR